MSPRNPISRTFHTLLSALLAGVSRLDKSLSPSLTISRLRAHHFTPSDAIYIFHFLLASFWLVLMQRPPFPYKLGIPLLYSIALLIPLTSQFFIPATPVFAWILTFYSNQFIPSAYRPAISVSLLPTLESVLYGANISDILTRFTHPLLDILAWLPYGVIHFVFPFVVAAFLWLFRSKESLHLWARTFGYMNLTGVIIQILLPCSAPWYELIYGLTPANYSMKGSPGGLARIDALFGGNGYQVTFSNSPVVFGAFPSLHAGCATLEALFISHFFPQATKFVWAYAGVLYWATMYLTHHYLIDVVGGACLATMFFYLFLSDELRGAGRLAPPGMLGEYRKLRSGRNKYETYDLEAPVRTGGGLEEDDFALEESDGEGEEDITYRSPAADRTVFAGEAGSGGKTKGGVGRGKENHRHTASIASLIRGDERSPEDGWSPVAGAFGVGKGRE